MSVSREIARVISASADCACDTMDRACEVSCATVDAPAAWARDHASCAHCATVASSGAAGTSPIRTVPPEVMPVFECALIHAALLASAASLLFAVVSDARARTLQYARARAGPSFFGTGGVGGGGLRGRRGALLRACLRARGRGRRCASCRRIASERRRERCTRCRSVHAVQRQAWRAAGRVPRILERVRRRADLLGRRARIGQPRFELRRRLFELRLGGRLRVRLGGHVLALGETRIGIDVRRITTRADLRHGRKCRPRAHHSSIRGRIGPCARCFRTQVGPSPHRSSTDHDPITIGSADRSGSIAARAGAAS